MPEMSKPFYGRPLPKNFNIPKFQIGVFSPDQFDFFFSSPTFNFFLSFYGLVSILKTFKVQKVKRLIFGCETLPLYTVKVMSRYSFFQVIRNSCIKHCSFVVSNDVDVI